MSGDWPDQFSRQPVCAAGTAHLWVCYGSIPTLVTEARASLWLS